MTEISLRAIEGTREDLAELQRALEAVPAYYSHLHGGEVGFAEAQSVYTIVPEGCPYEDKFVYGIFRAGEIVGCAEAVRHYPRNDTTIIGLLTVSESLQRSGIGTSAYHRLEEQFRSWPGIAKIRIAVIETLEGALAFWEKLGFSPTGETVPHDYGSIHSRKRILEKQL